LGEIYINVFVIKDRFWIVLWRERGIRKREINDLVVLLILYSSTYAMLLLAWKEERREAIKPKRLLKPYAPSPVKFHLPLQTELPMST
jgi:hypothetical protein